MSEQEEDLNLEDLQKNDLRKKWKRLKMNDSQKNDLPDNTLGFITPARINYNETKPVSHYINYALLNDSNREKNNIHALIMKKVNAFVKEQSQQNKLEDASQLRESKLNVYETVFNIVIPDFIDDFECLPNFQIYWDSVWGGMVTLRIFSTFKQFTFLTSLLSEVTDLLFKSNMLNGSSQSRES